MLCLGLQVLLYRSSESRHPYLFPDLGRKVFNFSSLTMMILMRLSCMVFIVFRKFSCIPNLLYVFIMKIWYLNFPNACLASVEMIELLLSFVLVIWWIIIINMYIFDYMEPILHPRDKLQLIMVNNLFNVQLNAVCWHFVASFCISMFSSNILQFSFLIVFLSGIDQSNAGFIWWVWKYASSLTYWKSLRTAIRSLNVW